MGKATKWFRGLLGLKKTDSSSSSAPKEKRIWRFGKSYRQNDNLHANTVQPPPIQNNRSHADVVAPNREQWAAVKIQAAFRASLARKALRALKGLVKLQALVKGHIVRKRTAQRLQKMHVLLRAQARARAGRLNSSFTAKSSNVHLHGPSTPDKSENPIRSKSMKYDESCMLKINCNQEKYWNTTDSWVDEKSWNRQRSSARTCSMEDERNVKILEMDDSGRSHWTPKRRARNLFQFTNMNALDSDQNHYYQSGPIIHSYEVQDQEEESPFCTAHNSSHQYLSGCSGFTPTRSDGSRSNLSAYSECPSYMACTESSKAKVRSLSAPKQRPPQYERCGSSSRYSMNAQTHGRAYGHLHASFNSKAYPASGRLDKLGMPAGYSVGNHIQ